MSCDLLVLLLERKIGIDEFRLWISGENVENINNRLSRTGFSLYVLNFIQQQISRLFPLLNGDKQLDSKLIKESTPVNNKVSSSSSSSSQSIQSVQLQKNVFNNTLQFNESCNDNFILSLENEKHCVQGRMSSESLVYASPQINNSGHKSPNPYSTPPFPPVPYSPTYNEIRIGYNNQAPVLYNSPQIQNNFQQKYQHNPNNSNRKHNKSPSKSSLHFGDFIPKGNQTTPVMSCQQRPLQNKSHAVRAHLFSESSESSVDSYQSNPKSSTYDQNFPDLSSGKRVNHRFGQNSNLYSSNLITQSSTINLNPNNSPQNSSSLKSPKKSNHFNTQQKMNLKQSGKKRVNPTRVKDSPMELDNEDMKMKHETFGTAIRVVPSESSPFQQSATVEPRTNYDEERLILKQKRSEPLIRTENNPQTAILPNAPILNLISPDPCKVTHSDYIECLATIYCILLDLNLIPNVTAELHFIFSLLTVQVKNKCLDGKNKNDVKKDLKEKMFVKERKEIIEKSIVPLTNICNLQDDDKLEQTIVPADNSSFPVCENEELKPRLTDRCVTDIQHNQNILGNIHNCVMFAVVVITKQMHIIKQLDRITLKLLADNDRLKLYDSSFASNLNHLYQKKEVLIKNIIYHDAIEVRDATVKFQLDTDNRDNFSHVSSFSSFRKQRDMFYDILHNWRTKRTEPRSDRIFQLLALSNDPINMTHLARLVCCQLISDTVNKTDQDSETPEGSLLPGITKDKLSLLEARLKNPQGRNMGSPRPPTQFPDDQHFYKIFLDVASENSFFREHIIDCLITRILELDDTSFEFDESDSRWDEITLEFRHTVILSCLLAKFLGLVVFSPYSRLSNLPENIIETQISIRQNIRPPLDVVVHLQKSINQKRLIKTVPWVIEYLGMMDCVSPFLPCYRPVLQTLIEMYRSLSPYYFLNTNMITTKNKNEEKQIVYNETDINIDIIDGNHGNKQRISSSTALLLRLSLGWLFDSSFFPESLFFSLAEASGTILQFQNGEEIKYSLDSLDLVDDKFIFECCPYFIQIKLLLMANAGVKGGSVKHITPVSAQINVPSESVGATVLQLQLEKNFLSGQAASFQATIDFVKERIASACIKYICSNVIAKAKQEAIEKLSNLQTNSDKKKKETISQCITDLKVDIDLMICGFCESRILSSLEALLGPELLDPKMINISLKITTRRCKEKIVDWLNSHINLTDIFTKLTGSAGQSDSIESKKREEKDKEAVSCNNPDENNHFTYQYDESDSQIDAIIYLKDFMCEIIEDEIPDLCEMKVIRVLQRLRNIDTMYHSLLITISVDLSVILVAYHPEIMTQAVLLEFGQLWNSLELTRQGTENPFQRLICPRNILLFCQQNPTKSWTALSGFIVSILSNRFISLQQLEIQFVAIFRHTWTPVVLKLISSCLKSTLEKVKQENICPKNDKVMLMLELVSETSQEL